MAWRRPCPSAWSLVFVLGLLLAEAVHGAGAQAAAPPAPRLVPAEGESCRTLVMLRPTALSFLGSVVASPHWFGENWLRMHHVLQPCLGVLSYLITATPNLPKNLQETVIFSPRKKALWLVLLTDHLLNVNVITDQSLNSCKPGHVAATRNPFAPFPLFNPNALSSAETVCLQSPFAARVLRRIAAALGVSHWDFAAGPCDYGGSGVHCDCSFSNGTVCHVTEMYASLLTFSHSFRQQNGVRGFLRP